MKGQRIDTRAKQKRIERCPNLLRVFTKQVFDTVFFSDEKIFKMTQLLNVQNNRTYAPSAYKKSTIENQTLVRGPQWLSYEPHSVCCRIKSWQIIHFLR